MGFTPNAFKKFGISFLASGTAYFWLPLCSNGVMGCSAEVLFFRFYAVSFMSILIYNQACNFCQVKTLTGLYPIFFSAAFIGHMAQIRTDPLLSLHHLMKALWDRLKVMCRFKLRVSNIYNLIKKPYGCETQGFFSQFYFFEKGDQIYF